MAEEEIAASLRPVKLLAKTIAPGLAL